MSRKITWDEIAKHNQANDIWVVVEGGVYDPSLYQDDHPGGPAVLRNRAGRDASRDFNETGHTQNAREKMQSFKVGEVDTNSIPLPWQQTSSQGINGQQLAMLIGALIIVLAFYYILKFI